MRMKYLRIPSCDMCNDLVSPLNLNTKTGIGQGLGHRPFHFERFFFFFRHSVAPSRLDTATGNQSLRTPYHIFRAVCV